jgi:nucleoside-diphosphate-sugar epimerase
VVFAPGWCTTMNGQAPLILVTGANGFVGSNLVEALVERGYRVRGMVRRTSDLTHIRDLPIELAYTDMRDAESLYRTCQGVDVVIHCAAMTRALDEETFLEVNARGTEALALASLRASPNLQRFVFVSSQAAAGPAQDLNAAIDESCPPNPVTWYGRSKLAAERALQAMATTSPPSGTSKPLPLTIVRPAPVYGPRDRDFFAYFDLVQHRLSLQLGRQERFLSLIYVRDLVELIVLATENKAALGQTYFGCSRAHSYTDLSEAIGRALGKKTLRITIPLAVLTPIALWSRVQGRITGKPALLNDQRVLDMRQRYWLCSGEKARQELGFAPRYDLDTAVQETAAWYRQNGWLG